MVWGDNLWHEFRERTETSCVETAAKPLKTVGHVFISLRMISFMHAKNVGLQTCSEWEILRDKPCLHYSVFL